MTQVRARGGSGSVRQDLPALVAVFLLIVGFTFSDDVVEFLLDMTGNSDLAATNRHWLVMGLDVVFVVVTAVLKWQIHEDRRTPAQFLRQLLTGPWAVGALLVLAGHLALILTAEHRSGLSTVASFWINIAASTVFVAAMTTLLLSVLSEKSGSRSWIAPLVFGTFVVQIASALWYPVIETNDGCAGEVSSQFFLDMVQMLSIVLLTLAVELSYVRRGAVELDPGRRMAPVFVVLMLCTAVGLGLTMDVKADQDTLCGMGAVWHEYFSFVVCVQALAIGLATLMWMLLVDAMSVE